MKTFELVMASGKRITVAAESRALATSRAVELGFLDKWDLWEVEQVIEVDVVIKPVVSEN
jgi:hypothetical protein